jgi:hypothetical protein
MRSLSQPILTRIVVALRCCLGSTLGGPSSCYVMGTVVSSTASMTKMPLTDPRSLGLDRTQDMLRCQDLPGRTLAMCRTVPHPRRTVPLGRRARRCRISVKSRSRSSGAMAIWPEKVRRRLM